VIIQCDIVGIPGVKMPGMVVCRDHALSIWSGVQHANAMVPKVKPLTKGGKPIDGWIYYIRLDEKIKIGWTANLQQRIKSYPPHAVVLIEHPGTRYDERDLHRTFKPSRAAGREWYRPHSGVAHAHQASRISRDAATIRRASGPGICGCG